MRTRRLKWQALLVTRWDRSLFKLFLGNTHSFRHLWTCSSFSHSARGPELHGDAEVCSRSQGSHLHLQTLPELPPTNPLLRRNRGHSGRLDGKLRLGCILSFWLSPVDVPAMVWNAPDQPSVDPLSLSPRLILILTSSGNYSFLEGRHCVLFFFMSPSVLWLQVLCCIHNNSGREDQPAPLKEKKCSFLGKQNCL